MVKIVIIGAGLAGFAAGVKLMENGFEEITILEAENRIGGRIHTIEYGEGKLDMGGQWVQGIKNNVIYDLTKDHFNFGVQKFDKIEPTFIASDGVPVDQEKCSRLYELADKILDDSYLDMRKFNGSLGDFFIEQYNKNLNTAKYADIDLDFASNFLDTIHNGQNGYYASPSWFDVSARLNTEYDSSSNDQMNTWKDKGFITAFDYISKKLPTPEQHIDVESKIQFNKEVIHIKYSEDKNEKTKIECSDGSTYEADHLIITVSLGVLKANYQELFDPPLPDKKVKVIQNYAFGAIGKFFLEFEKPFWPQNESFSSFLPIWRDKDRDEIKLSNKSWLLGIAILHVVDGFVNLLEGFISGEEVRNFETISDEKFTEDVMWMLEKFLGTKLQNPINVKRTDWLTSKNFLGTYSYIGMGLQKHNLKPKDLAEPLKKSNGKAFIHFAGEATDIEYPSFAHGAVSSGLRAADEIIKCY